MARYKLIGNELVDITNKNKTNSTPTPYKIAQNKDKMLTQINHRKTNDSTTMYKIENEFKLKNEVNKNRRKYIDSKNILTDTLNNQGLNVNRNNPFQANVNSNNLINNSRTNLNGIVTLNDVVNNQKKVLENNKELVNNVNNSMSDYAKSNYLYNKQKVDNDNVSLYDKTLGTAVRGVSDLFSNIITPTSYIIDENGRKVKAPTYNELKQSKVSENYNTGVGKFLGDATYNMSKILGSQAINAVTGGVGGTALYWSDMFFDNYHSSVRDGHDNNNAMAYALASTAAEYLTGKFLGSATKQLTGGKTNEYEKLLDKVFTKFISNKNVTTFLSNAGSEATEEFIQEYLDNINKNLILGENNKVFSLDTLADAAYSAGLGAISGGTIGVLNSKIYGETPDTNVIPNDISENIEEKKSKINSSSNITENEKNINSNDTKTSIDSKIDINTEMENITNEINEYQQLRRENKLTSKQEQYLNQLKQKLNELQNTNTYIESSSPTRQILPTVQDIVNQEQMAKNTSINLPVDNQQSIISNMNNANSEILSSNKKILPTINDFNGSNINIPTNNIKIDMTKIKPEILEDIKGFKLGDPNIESYKGSYIKTMLNEVGIKVPNAMNYVSEVRPDMSFTTTKDLTRQQYASIGNALQKLKSVDVTSVNNANYSIPIGNYQYVKSSNANINELRRTASMYLNNTARSNNTIKLLENIIKDRNYIIRFNPNITNEQGVPVNGLITKENGKTIIELNPNADNYVEFLVVHEITHDIATKEMKELILDYAKQDSEFEKSLESLKERYKTNDVSDEVVADVCGELFGNREFIQSVVEKKPSIFKKILNNIRKLAEKIKGTSADEYVSFVEKLKTMWEDAYYSNRSNLNKIEYHLSENALNEVNDALNNPNTDINSMVKLRDFTPEQLVSVGVSDLPMLVRKGHLRENILTSSEAENKGYSTKGKHYHGLGIETYMNAIDSLDNPIAVYQYTDKGNYSKDNFIVLTEVKDSDNNNIIVPIEIHKRGQYNKVEIDINKIKTTYGKNNSNYFDNMIKTGSLVEIYNKKRSAKLPIQSGNLNTSVANNIPQSNNNVNSNTSSATKYSIPINKNNTQELNNSSISFDNKGRKLSKEQQEYFKNSKVRDENGNLKVMYHGTKNDFTIFDINKSGKSSQNSKVGFWFTENSEGAEKFANNVWYGKNKEAKSMEVYLNIKNPKIYENIDNSAILEQLKKQSANIKKQKESIEEKYLIDSFNPNYSSYDGRLFLKYCGMYGSKYSSYTKEEMLEFIKEDYNINTNEKEYFNDVKKYSELIAKEKENERKRENLRYTDSYEQFRGDIYSIVGKDLYDANIGGTGIALNNESEIIEKYVSKLENDGYDGIAIKNTDYDTQTLGEKNTQYVAFYPNQIKNVDNTNPTSNKDIRYSQTTKEWNEYLKDNFPSAGTKTKMSDIKLPIRENIKNDSKKSSILNPNEISKLTKEDANTTPILPVRGTINKVNDGDSHFANNIREKVNMLNVEQKAEILSNEDVRYYDKVTNKESMEKAFKRLNDGGESETFNWLSKKEGFTDIDVAEGWVLLKQYQDRIQNTTDLVTKDNLNKSMVEVAKKMREIGTTAGQTVQAFNIMERMTPEGMVKYAQSELSEAYDRMVKNKSKEWIDKHRENFDLKPNEVQFIMDTMQEVQNMEDGYDKRVKLAEIQKLMTDKLPPEKGAKIKSWMRISMLFNPKTQVRNVAGNALIMPVNSFGDLFSSYADKLIAKRTGVRTTGTTNIKAMLKGIKKGAYEATNDYKKGINTKDMEGNRFEISDGKSFSEKNLMGRTLNRTESLLNYVMDVGDRVFSEAAFENSLQNQLVLNNTTEITQEMIDIAHQEALSRTWNDNNNYTRFVLNARAGLNKFANFRGYGLGDVLIPFAKTPANLTKAIIDFSPAGLVSTINKGINLKKSFTNGQYTATMQHEFVQSLGKATAGTMLYILGVALAKAGITSGDSDDDKDTANFLKNTLGINSYSIKIGGKSFAYDWAQPLAAPLSITANVVNSKKNDTQALLEGIIGSLDTAGSILLEQSFLQSINDVLNDNDGVASGIINEVLELPARAVPTFSKQIADLVDGTQRTSFEYGKPVQSAINSIKAKIPFVSKTLSPSVDTLGREIRKYGGKNNIFNVFLNPANVNTENISKSAEEIYRLYKETGNQTIMPRVAPYYINKNGEKITMTSKERAKYQKISGRIIEDNVQLLLKDNSYKEMNDTEKTEVINKIINYSYNKAREEVLNIGMSNEYNKINSYVNNGGNVANYYLNKKEIDYSYTNPIKYKIITQITTYNDYLSYKENIDEIKDNYTNTYQRKAEIIKYVNSLNLTIPQKAMLIKMNYTSYSNYNNQIINYINEQDISIDEKKEILEELGFKVRNGRVYTK